MEQTLKVSQSQQLQVLRPGNPRTMAVWLGAATRLGLRPSSPLWVVTMADGGGGPFSEVKRKPSDVRELVTLL